MARRISLMVVLAGVATSGSAQPPTCAEFGGKWQGSCQTTQPFSSKGERALLTVDQVGCTKFTANSMAPTLIGETRNERYEEHDYVGFITYNFDWNVDHTVLYTVEINSDRVTDNDRFGSWVTSELATTAYRLDGQNLIREIDRVKFTIDNGHPSESRFKMRCEYQRVP